MEGVEELQSLVIIDLGTPSIEMIYNTYSDSTGTIEWNSCAYFVSPDGSRWSSKPYTKEQSKLYKQSMEDEHMAHRIIKFVTKLNKKLSDEFCRINEGTSTLSKKCQKWFTEHYRHSIAKCGKSVIVIPDSYNEFVTLKKFASKSD